MRHTDFSSSKLSWWATGIVLGLMAAVVWFFNMKDAAELAAPPPVTQAELTPCRTLAATKRLTIWDCDGMVFSQRKEKK